MKYISLVLLSTFLFACSQESSTSAEASAVDEKSLSESTALIEAPEISADEHTLAKKTYKQTTFPASRKVTQFPVRMEMSTTFSKTAAQSGSNPCYKITGTAKTVAKVYDSNVGDYVAYNKPFITSYIYPFDTRYPNKTFNGQVLAVNTGSNDATADIYYGCTYKKIAFIGVHRIEHGKDTVLVTTSQGFDSEVTAKTYYDKYIKHLWN